MPLAQDSPPAPLASFVVLRRFSEPGAPRIRFEPGQCPTSIRTERESRGLDGLASASAIGEAAATTPGAATRGAVPANATEAGAMTPAGSSSSPKMAAVARCTPALDRRRISGDTTAICPAALLRKPRWAGLRRDPARIAGTGTAAAAAGRWGGARLPCHEERLGKDIPRLEIGMLTGLETTTALLLAGLARRQVKPGTAVAIAGDRGPVAMGVRGAPPVAAGPVPPAGIRRVLRDPADGHRCRREARGGLLAGNI